MFARKKKPEAADSPQRETELVQQLARQRSELTSIGAERKRLTEATHSARAARELAYAALASIIGDPMRFATTPDAELASAKQALVAAAKNEESSASELAAHQERYGDLVEAENR